MFKCAPDGRFDFPRTSSLLSRTRGGRPFPRAFARDIEDTVRLGETGFLGASGRPHYEVDSDERALQLQLPQMPSHQQTRVLPGISRAKKLAYCVPPARDCKVMRTKQTSQSAHNTQSRQRLMQVRSIGIYTAYLELEIVSNYTFNLTPHT